MDTTCKLQHEVERYRSIVCRITELLEETNKLFEEVDRNTGLNGVQLSGESFEEEADVRQILQKNPVVVVFGQSNSAKASIANKLLGEVIIPSSAKPNARWRPVLIRYGLRRTVSLSLPGSYELVSPLRAYNGPWHTIPGEDLEMAAGKPGSADDQAALEVCLCNPALKSGLQIIILPNDDAVQLGQSFAQYTEGAQPVVIFAIDSQSLSSEDVTELTEFYRTQSGVPVLFVQLAVAENKCTLPQAQAAMAGPTPSPRGHSNGCMVPLDLFEQLCKIGYLSMLPQEGRGLRLVDPSGPTNAAANSGHIAAAEARATAVVESELIEDVVDNSAATIDALQQFVRNCLQSQMVAACALLNVAHARSLNGFIMCAFDIQRDMLITPKRLDFARIKEQELFARLTELTALKQEEIRELVARSIAATHDTIMESLLDYEFIGISFNSDGKVCTAGDLRMCTGQIRELVLGKLNGAIAGKLVDSVNVLRDSFIGTLTRCLESLESSDGTSTGNKENVDGHSATVALKQILNTAYLVDVNVNSGPSALRTFVAKMKQLIHSLPWNTPPTINTAWKQAIAADMLLGLNELRLARSICEQIKERLRHSHEAFGAALRQLELRHGERLERTEGQRLRLRKFLSPTVARLALESASLKDSIVYGMPLCGREIGRGQYGVVYSCEEWAGHRNCAVKSVVPPDDKHWNDLALEFFYTKNVPEHERIVGIHGSVIDYSYGDGKSPAVLIIMDRLQRDFYTAIKSGTEWRTRLQVSIDVIEGIRFLHSQGLVHRDIKLKNVLLNSQNRGLLTDLGFCKSEAMMSGTIVGTPIHMAPELFLGQYDHTVDVYAFGILFWYVCAGHVNLPYNFQVCDNKDQLWTSVRKGVRPERLAQFDEECWQLMQDCWESEPTKRPLLGDVECLLRSVLARFTAATSGSAAISATGSSRSSVAENAHDFKKLPTSQQPKRR